MNGVDDRLAIPRILPLSLIGARERRACATFVLADGRVLALQVTCTAGDRPTATAFHTLRPASEGEWGPAAPLVIEHPVPSVLSLAVPPVLARDGAGRFTVAWAFEEGGHLSLTDQGASVVEDPGEGRITALCADGDDLYAAMRRDEDGGAALFVRSELGGWRAIPTRGMLCAAGEAVTALAVFQGHLYAATSDAKAGFSLWRAPLGVEEEWQAVMTRGAWRHGYNRSVSAIAAIGPWLYVAADGPDTSHVRLGDEHPEILAVDADGGWRLFSGQGRFSPDGLRLSATIAGPGAPDSAGLTVGGIQAQGEDVLVWLRPRGASGTGPVSVRRWSAASGAWSAPEAVPLPQVTVTTLAVAGDGTILVAAGADLASVHPQEAPRPLLVALAL